MRQEQSVLFPEKTEHAKILTPGQLHSEVIRFNEFEKQLVALNFLTRR